MKWELWKRSSKKVGRSSREKVSAGDRESDDSERIKFVSAPLYMFSKFFEGKATEHLLGTGITARQIQRRPVGKVLDDLQEVGLTEIQGISNEISGNMKSR
jgi:hypothetical protein